MVTAHIGMRNGVQPHKKRCKGNISSR